jgi:hypothetical protein
VVNEDNSSERAELFPTPRRRLNPDGELMRVRPSSMVCADIINSLFTSWLAAEQQGEKDAQDEENTPQTPAEGAAEGETTAAAAAPVEEEEEEVTKSYDEYLAERAATQNSTFGKKEGRQVNNETVEGVQFRREAIDDFFSGGKVRNFAQQGILADPCSKRRLPRPRLPPRRRRFTSSSTVNSLPPPVEHLPVIEEVEVDEEETGDGVDEEEHEVVSEVPEVPVLAEVLPVAELPLEVDEAVPSMPLTRRLSPLLERR